VTALDRGAALVTGAASGIGAAIARRLIEAGYRAALLDRDRHLLDAVRSELGPRSHALLLDITDKHAVAALPATLPPEFAAVRVLVNAAGHDPGGTTRFDEGDADDWASAIETNLIGTLRVTRAVLPGMVARNAGDIVNIGSIAGIRIVPDMAAYNTSKAGIHAFSDHLRTDLRDTAIRVIEILPGLTKTDLIRKRYRGDEQRTDEYYARFKIALEPDDIARTVLYALNAPAHMVLAQAVVLPANRW
jgi:3-hydroxy acid dehydrogenase / malonic semialdehyde reductase